MSLHHIVHKLTEEMTIEDRAAILAALPREEILAALPPIDMAVMPCVCETVEYPCTAPYRVRFCGKLICVNCCDDHKCKGVL